MLGIIRKASPAMKSLLSSYGINEKAFLSVLKNAKPLGSHVYISGMNQELRNVFTMTGFINLFEFK